MNLRKSLVLALGLVFSGSVLAATELVIAVKTEGDEVVIAGGCGDAGAERSVPVARLQIAVLAHSLALLGLHPPDVLDETLVGKVAIEAGDALGHA